VEVQNSDSWYTAYFLPLLSVALNATNLDWSTGGNSPWFGQLAVNHDGFAAAQTGTLGVGQTNWVQAVITNGPGW